MKCLWLTSTNEVIPINPIHLIDAMLVLFYLKMLSIERAVHLQNDKKQYRKALSECYVLNTALCITHSTYIRYALIVLDILYVLRVQSKCYHHRDHYQST